MAEKINHHIVTKINELSKELNLVKTYLEFGKIFAYSFKNLLPEIEKAVFYNFSWHNKSYELFAGFGFEKKEIPYPEEDIKPLLESVFENNSPIIINNNETDKELLNFSKGAEGAEALLPIVPFNEPTGVLYIFCSQAKFNCEEDLAICELISAMMARAIKRLNLQTHQIKQSKTAEKRYISQKNLMSEILNYVPVGIFMKDEEGKYIFYNKQAEETSGHHDGEVLGKNDYELFPKEIAERSLMIDEEIKKAKKPINVQEDFIVDGEVRHMFTGKKLITTNEQKEQILGFSIDITENINTQRDLEEQKRFIQQVLDASPNLIYVKNKLGKFLMVNQTMANLFNTSKKEILESSSSKRKFELYDKELDNIQKVIKTGKVMENENVFQPSSTEQQWFHFTKLPLPGKNKTMNVLCIGVDITAQKKNAEELIKAQKAKEQFLANMSHEIRTPINGIVGMINLLASTPTNNEQKKYIESIKHASETLKGIISEILDFSVIESGKVKFDKVSFKPKRLYDEIVYTFENIINEKGLKFNYYYDKTISDVLIGDPVRLNQIIINLTNNAIKFTSKGFIRLVIENLGIFNGKQKLKITVEDSGIGIADDKLESIFESFRQADDSINRNFGGTGLGLAICKQLVDLQDGTINLESGPGKGSKFTVVIPFDIGNEKDLATYAEDQISRKNLSGKADFDEMRVLLVEDNEINVFYAKTVLNKLNCKVFLAENGKTAIEMYHQNDYDAILMDLQMPVMDGYEATNYIRKKFNSPKKEIPIIAITANAIKGERERCINAGMNDYISKPFEPKMLENVLSQFKTPIIKRSSKTEIEEPQVTKKKLVDLTYLKKISDGDKAFMKDMVETFIQNNPADLKNLRALLNEKNWKEMANLAHKLKPSVKFMGIQSSLDKVLKIEELTKNEKQLDEVPSILNKLENECAQAIAELNEILDTDFKSILKTT